jgi:hypothetical protein
VVGGGLSFGLGNIIPIVAAAVGQVVLLGARLQNEDYLRGILTQRDEKANTLTDQQLEDVLENMDFETRQRVRYIVQLHREVVREARGDDVQSYARTDLERIATQLAPLIQRAVSLGTKKQQLAKYLRNVDERALKSYCNSLRQRIETTTDSVQKAQFEQALKAREAELDTYQGIAQACARIDSQLENVEATFASWKARMLRIKTADMAGASSASDALDQELSSLNSDIDLLDTSVAEALASDEQVVRVSA